MTSRGENGPADGRPATYWRSKVRPEKHEPGARDVSQPSLDTDLASKAADLGVTPSRVQ